MNSNERKILADALKRYHDCAFTPGVYEHSIVGQAALILENYVEVVRCKDCKRWHKDTFSCDFMKYGTHVYQPNWYEEDFCSYGERRTK